MAAGKQTAIFRGSVITIHYYKLLKIAVDRTVLAEGRQMIIFFEISSKVKVVYGPCLHLGPTFQNSKN